MIAAYQGDLPRIGYLFHYPDLAHPTEKFRLDIYVSATPSERHFDVLRVYLSVRTPEGQLEQLKITHPWRYEASYQACGGVVIMEDRKGKKVEAFHFGGELKIINQENHTTCVLTSSAPILDISAAKPVQALFIEELESLFAKKRAAELTGLTYELSLCGADPDQLYIASLRALIDTIEKPAFQGERYQQLLFFLHAEEHRLINAGMVKEPVRSLEELLAG